MYRLPLACLHPLNESSMMQSLKKSMENFSSPLLRKTFLWSSAVLFSILLNIAFFGLMPGLINKNLPEKKNLISGSIIQLVRVKRIETPVRKKKLKKQPPPKEVKSLQKPMVRHKQKINMAKLPFELNPRLSQNAGTMPVPEMEMAIVPLTDLLEAVAFSGWKDIYEIGELDNPMTPLSQVPPLYPLRAKRMGIEGWVDVKFLVTEKGLVDQITILKAKPEKIFDQSVIRCVSSWRFSSGTVEGVPVKTWVMTTIRFELE